MRRKDREVTGADALEEILEKCQVCRLALHGPEYPYVVPLNFGYARDGERFSLYFHGAREGTKMVLLRADPRAAFEMDTALRLIPANDACAFTMEYESLTGCGLLSVLEGEEKRAGLSAIMRQYAPGRTFSFRPAELESVAVLRLSVLEMTGKRLCRG